MTSAGVGRCVAGHCILFHLTDLQPTLIRDLTRSHTGVSDWTIIMYTGISWTIIMYTGISWTIIMYTGVSCHIVAAGLCTCILDWCALADWVIILVYNHTFF